jgi:hypothetical protein
MTIERERERARERHDRGVDRVSLAFRTGRTILCGAASRTLKVGCGPDFDDGHSDVEHEGLGHCEGAAPSQVPATKGEDDASLTYDQHTSLDADEQLLDGIARGELDEPTPQRVARPYRHLHEAVVSRRSPGTASTKTASTRTSTACAPTTTCALRSFRAGRARPTRRVPHPSWSTANGWSARDTPSCSAFLRHRGNAGTSPNAGLTGRRASPEVDPTT